MKGLREYIRKHGRHFTEELAYKAAGRKYSASQVERAAQRKVYYNVTGSTLGDMVYLTNCTYNGWGFTTISGNISYTLYFVGNYKHHGGVLFNEWLHGLEDFDFTPYI